ncbi:MAG: hypothetical protein AUJ72_01365 [Candidatus Omnitrophica bacterium CG1_02_46_14]|nr:MAG: hypothetical protein AUJ72_01365 [Candidatus Omnitrophica bacterium CG1_02_46_14]
MFILLAFLFVQVFFAMQTKSPTCDEFAHHTASGYSHLVTGDFRMNPAEPPFSRFLSAIPLYFIGAKAPLDHWSWEKGDSPEFARQFFYGVNHDQDRLIFWARFPILIVSLVFGYFVYWWAKTFFGMVGGLAALALYAFCPDIIAHSGLATSDISVAFFFYLTLYRFWKYLRKPSLKNMALTGAVTGLAFLSKFSAILIFPILFLTVLFTNSWNRIPVKRCAGFLLITFLTVWAGYFFELKPLLKNTPNPPKKAAFLKKIGGDRLVRFGKDVPIPLSTFVSAFGSMMITRVNGTNCFLMGEWSHSKKSWWNYYLIAFGIKNTIPFLILILLSLFFLPKIPADRVTKIFLFTPIIFFFLITMRDKAQAGIRYFLPIYPLFFILCGGWVAWVWKKAKSLRLLVLALFFWHAFEALNIYPDYLSYFNQSIGGPDKGYLYLRDSNIDWGQDLKGVADWVKKENNPELVLSSISIVDIKKAYGVPWRMFTSKELKQPGPYVYAIGVHSIDGIEWSQQYKPVKIIGHSMWIYDFRKK